MKESLCMNFLDCGEKAKFKLVYKDDSFLLVCIECEKKMTSWVKKKRLTGFAVIPEAQHKMISGHGGRAAHAKGVAPLFTKRTASAAGQKSQAACPRCGHRTRGLGCACLKELRPYQEN